MSDKQNKKIWYISGLFFLLFIILMLAIKFIDVKPIGPNGSEIGLATLNKAVFDFFGVNLILYDITDIFGMFAIAVAFCFAFIGFAQLVKRKSIKKIDSDIIILGIFYAVVVGVYVFFEIFVLNYRPVILETELEASFPSSHTMLIMCIMGTAVYQFLHRFETKLTRNVSTVLSVLLIVVTVIGRLASGVHWFTDILGGVFLSTALIMAYIGMCQKYGEGK